MARNVVVFVADGLRPGSINAIDTPTLFSIKQTGVNFANSHSLFPTFTTPNASAIATGHYLGDTGDFSNTVYTGYPVLNANGSVTPFIENDPILADINANSNLADPDTGFNRGNFLTEESLLAYARTQGYSTAAIGKIGPVVIQDPTQDVRTGGAATPNITPKTVILDDATYINSIANATTPPVSATSGSQLAVPVSTTIANDLNAAGLIGSIIPGSITATNPTGTVATQIASIRSNQPSGNLTTAGTLNSNAQQQQYFADATTKAVLPQFVADIKGGTSKGFATVYWSRDPDGTQHNNGDAFNAADPGNNSLTIGINGDTAKKGVADADANLAQIIAYLKATDDPANPGKKLYDNTDIFVTADHGFSTISKQAVGVTFDAAGKPTFIPTKSYAATLDYYTTDAAGVKTATVHKGFLPPGFVAIDLAKDLGAILYDPNKPTAAVTTANLNNIQYTAIDPTLGQLTTSGNGVIGGTGKVTNGVIDAGTKVVIAANGGSDLLYVPSNDPALVKQIVALLAAKDYISGIFTDDKFGDVPGALKMSTIGLIGNAELPTPSIAINFKTFSTNPKDPNDPYTQVEVADTTLQQGQGMHGSFGRGDTFNNMLAIGPDFKSGYTDNAPISNADVVPTLASILGWKIPSVGKLVGRVASEALVGGPATVSATEATLTSTPVNGLSTLLKTQTVGTTQYFDVAGVPGGTDGLGTSFSGVAAGDATANSAILWTRTFNPTTKNGVSVKLNLQVATDANFTTPLSLAATTDPTHDYTTKIDVTGLKSGTQYYYRFQTTAGDSSSQVGTFKTALDPNVAAPVRFGFSGDSNGFWRPFPSTANFGKLGLDYFIYDGDTLYETASKGSPAAADPGTNPAQALIDYRRKYLENIQPTTPGGFSGLQTLYASQGNYTLLDNHELGNKELINGGAPAALVKLNANGSTNPADDVNTTGAFINKTAEFKNIEQAYLEYQPVREKIISAPNDPRTDNTQQLFFAQQWGKNSIFVNVDSRTYRDVRLNKVNAAGATVDDTGARADNPNRTLLGATQLAWLKKTLLDAQTNGTPWKFVTTSDPIDQIGALGSGDDGGKSWYGGYRAERNELLKFIADNGIKNVVFLATDDHLLRINELTYLDNINDPTSVRVLPNALSIVDGPLGSGGPDTITDHSPANIKAISDALAAKQISNGVNPIGLDPNFPGLKNLVRDGDPTANTSRQPFDFYSPDTFNYAVFDVSADGKTLKIDVQGINSYAADTNPEPSTTVNPVRSIVSFSLDAAAIPTVTAGTSGDDSIVPTTLQTIFTDGGKDTVDGSVGGGSNRIYGGDGNDELLAGKNDRLFGEAGNDILDASQGKGGNRLYGGDGNDTLFAGTNDFLSGGDGNDLLYAGKGGNTLYGGTGADKFYLAYNGVPTSTNTVADFEVGIDKLLILGVSGASDFSKVTLIAKGADTLVAAGGKDLAVLTGIGSSSLNAGSFAFV